MRRYLFSFVLLVLLSLASQANAATCYWVGGTGNFDNSNTASWSASSGGAGGTCTAVGGIPGNTIDTTIFDGSSGGGIVTVCGASSANCPTSSGSLAINQITFGAFTGTLNFATNNPNVSLIQGLSGTGTGTRTLNMGSGTWTLGWGGTWSFITSTNLTLNIGTSNIVLGGVGNSSTTTTFFGGGMSWGPLTITANNKAALYRFEPGGGGNSTYASWTVNSPVNIELGAAQNYTITNGIIITGSSALSPVYFSSDSKSSVTPTVILGNASVCSWCVFRGIIGSTNTWTATNSIDLGSNSGTLSITPPSSGGGGGKIIGG